MRITSACTLFRLTSYRSPAIRRYAHVLIQYRKSTPKKKGKFAVTPKSENADTISRDNVKELTPRQVKRLKYWSKATGKSRKDKISHEREAKAAENVTGIGQPPTLGAIDVPRNVTWKLFKRRKLLAVRIQLRLQAKQIQNALVKRRSLERGHQFQKLRIQRVESVRRHKRIYIVQKPKFRAVGNLHKVELQKIWRARKHKAELLGNSSSEIDRTQHRQIRISKHTSLRVRRYGTLFKTRLRIREQKSLRVRSHRGLVVSRTFGAVPVKKDKSAAVSTDTATEVDRWTPFMQRRIHRLASLETALDQFTGSLRTGRQPDSSATTSRKDHDPVEEVTPKVPKVLLVSESIPVPKSNSRVESPLLRQLRLHSRGQQRSFSNTSLEIARIPKALPIAFGLMQQASFTTSSRSLVRDVKVTVLPKSPLERKLEQSRIRQSKRQPTYSEYEELANNPWAVMLAGSVRQDNASRVRVPADLLVDCGLVTNPLDKQVYPMPTELADLRVFSDRLKTSRKRFTKARSSNDVKGNRTRISPYRLLLEELSDSMKVWDEREEVSRAKSGSVMRRMIPTKWLLGNEKHEAFQNASKEYWSMREAKGELDDDVFKRPEAPFDLRDLQWQTEIADRMASMMRQRVLITLNHVGNLRKARAASLPKYNSCFTWPNNLWLELDAKGSGAPMHELWNDMGDIESGDAINGTGARQGNSQDPRPPIAVTPSEISELTPSQATASLSVPDWLPGSFFLHIGPAATTLQALPYVGHSATSKSAISTEFQESKYITPMITVAQGHRLPVFNLSAMLGIEFTETLTELLDRHKEVLLDGLDMSETVAHEACNYLILFRADKGSNKNNGQITLAHELWQLWRFLGGRDCLVPAKAQNEPQHDEGEDVFEHVSKSMQSRLSKNSSAYEGVSAAAWKHLYELLELPHKES